MRKRLIVLVFLSGLAALFFGASAAGATHGNATYDCWNGKTVLNVTVLGDTVWSGFDTATYKIKDRPDLPAVMVQRDSTGAMPDVLLRISEGDVILGSYDGISHSRNVPVPYTVTGDKPVCEEETTTTVTGETTTTVTGQTTTTVVGQTTTTSDAHSENLPATGCNPWVIFAIGLICLIAGMLLAYTIWYIREADKK